MASLQSLRPLWRPVRSALRPAQVRIAVIPTFGTFRCFADRKTGTVKLWNDQKGFGFITPAEGGEDVFVHRTGIAEGVTLSPGLSVSFAPEWDDKKRKDRASDVQLEAGGEGSEASTAPQSSAVNSHHIVGSWEKWNIHKTAMAGDDSVVRHQVTIRNDAPKVGELRREEFQIVGNASWDIRLYPAGGDKQDDSLQMSCVLVVAVYVTGANASGLGFKTSFPAGRFVWNGALLVGVCTFLFPFIFCRRWLC